MDSKKYLTLFRVVGVEEEGSAWVVVPGWSERFALRLDFDSHRVPEKIRREMRPGYHFFAKFPLGASANDLFKYPAGIFTDFEQAPVPDDGDGLE